MIPLRAYRYSTQAIQSYPWSRLIKPLAFSTIFTGASFGTAYYLDKNTTRGPDAGLKTLTGLIAANAAVFAGLYVSRSSGGVYLRKLSQYTLLDATTVHKRPASVLTCGFSHFEIWHVGLNMVALYSFGSAIMPVLGPNQFLAFYTSGICWSSMAQLTMEVYRVRRGRIPRPSLGASGGVYALLGISAFVAPTASVSLLFLPFVAIPLGYAFTGIMALDLMGIIRGWSAFGHAAHFSGGLLGYSYAASGSIQAWRQAQKKSRMYLSRWGR